MIQSLRLQNYRSYKDESFEFENGVNIIVGPNASGKTNLLEGILVISRGNSFRVHGGSELIQFNQPWARLDAKTSSSPRAVKIVADGSGKSKKQFVIDDKNFSRLSLGRQLPVVLFEPSSLLMLHGSPDARRDYMDGLLSQTEEDYSRQLRDYKRAVAQRNALLKHGPAAAGQLFAWDVRISEIGGRIAGRRLELIELINSRLGKIYSSLAGSNKTTTVLEYNTACRAGEYASSLLSLLEVRQSTDIDRGFTTVGPHRDDMTLLFDGHTASEAASRGETRTAILALKIIELEIIEKVHGQKPIVLLDDVFSELDGKRRRALTDVIRGYQTFITTTDADVVIQHFMDKCHIIPLQN